MSKASLSNSRLQILFCFLADRLFVYFFFGKKKYGQKKLDSFFFFATIFYDAEVFVTLLSFTLFLAVFLKEKQWFIFSREEL
ncbi:MAG: hypothetical protein IKN49_01780 [Elusimicrobiaceae bacterium]|nr:hypothetical protein [Elusimicrobiaceae bacterium]